MEAYDIKFYRNNTLSFHDNEEILDWSAELNVTGEQGQAILHVDNDPDKGTSIQIGDSVSIFICTTGTLTPTTKVFSGEIESIRKVRDETDINLEVIAYDWSKLFSENNVNLSYPTVTNVSTIALGIISPISSGAVPPTENERKVSVNNLETVPKTRTIDFIGLSMNESLKKLSDYTYCDFYVDCNKDLNWFQRGNRIYATTLGDEKLTNYEYSQDLRIYNSVKVYGAENAPYPITGEIDTLSDSLEGWTYSVGSGTPVPFNLSLVSNLFTANRNNWTKSAKYVSFSLNVKNWILETQTNVNFTGTKPYLDNGTSNYLWTVGSWPELSIAKYFTFEKIETSYDDKNARDFQVSLFMGGNHLFGHPGTVQAWLEDRERDEYFRVGNYVFGELPAFYPYTPTEIEIDATTILPSYTSINNARLLLVANNDYQDVFYAKLLVDFTCDAGSGSPYINGDDTDSYIKSLLLVGQYDQEYINWGLVGNTIEFAWDDTYQITGVTFSFKCQLSVPPGTVELRPEIRTDKVGGHTRSTDYDEGWTFLAPITVTDSTWTTHSVTTTSSGVPLTDLFKVGSDLAGLEMRFVTPVGSTKTVQVTYATMTVSGNQITSAISLLSSLKKAGNYSLYMIHYPQEQPTSLEMWGKRIFPETIACQGVQNKQGFKELVWASYYNTMISSKIGTEHWELPNAKIFYNVYLGDASGNTIMYSAGDLIQEKNISPRPTQTYPDTLSELRLPVGEEAEAAGKWKYVSPTTTFDWSNVQDVKFSFTSSVADIIGTSVQPFISAGQFMIDWLHFEGGKWYAEYELSASDPDVLLYGRKYGEFHDESIFSIEDAKAKAEYIVKRYRKPINEITAIEVDYEEMEDLTPGVLCTIQIPEITGDATVRITKLTWIWDGDLRAQLEVETYP